MFVNEEMLAESYFLNGDRATGAFIIENAEISYEAVSSQTGDVYYTKEEPIFSTFFPVLKFGSVFAKREFGEAEN